MKVEGEKDTWIVQELLARIWPAQLFVCVKSSDEVEIPVIPTLDAVVFVRATGKVWGRPTCTDGKTNTNGEI